MKRENPAEKLKDVLELVHARRYSGLLSIERFEGGRFEEGEIYFERGQPVYARSRQKAGKEALSRMASWRQVYFTFDKNAPRPQTQDTTPAPSPPDLVVSASSLNEARQSTTSPLRSLSGLPFSEIELLIPRKLIINRDALALPLTRAQRSIYILIDGRRTIADLARCIGKNVQDIRILLNELLEQGLILVE